jgi:hypothetical protein
MMSKISKFLNIDNKICLVETPEKCEEIVRLCEEEDILVSLYFQYKNKERWSQSSSGATMNELWDNFLYVTVNCPNDGSIDAYYEIALKYKNVIFMNHTAPHKSNEYMRRRFGDMTGDYLRRAEDTFTIENGNGVATMKIVSDVLGETAALDWVFVGAGAVCELILQEVVKESPAEIVLVDLADKQKLADSVGGKYFESTTEVIPEPQSHRTVIIDSTTHHEGENKLAVAATLVSQSYDSASNLFIDYNMNVSKALYKDYKINVITGVEFVAYSNFVMLKYIEDFVRAKFANTKLYSFDEYRELVMRG